MYGFRWWKDLGMASQLSYIRDRSVEIYFGMLGMFFEPRYSLGRIHTVKLTMVLTVVDDTCDAYATLPEVISLHDAFQRYLFRVLSTSILYDPHVFSRINVTNKEINCLGGILVPQKNYQAI